MISGKFYCTRCDAVLNDQTGFNPDCGRWKCTRCGQELYGDGIYEGERFPGVMWHCTHCSCLLNSQLGFTDVVSVWTCEVCSQKNMISEDYLPQAENTEETSVTASELKTDIPEPEEKCETSRAVKAVVPSTDSFSDTVKSHKSSVTRTSAEKVPSANVIKKQKTDKEIQDELKKKRRKAFFFNKKKIRAGFSSHMAIGRTYEHIEQKLRSEGFTDIFSVPVKDIDENSMHCVSDIKQISIGDITNFSADDTFAYDSRIIITYHEKKEIRLPFSDSSIRRKKADELKDSLKSMGFIYIETSVIKDLKKGFLNKDGKIESVKFGDSSSYKNGSVFTYDTPVHITYHTFR